jgi:hypothetical protein
MWSNGSYAGSRKYLTNHIKDSAGVAGTYVHIDSVANDFRWASDDTLIGSNAYWSGLPDSIILQDSTAGGSWVSVDTGRATTGKIDTIIATGMAGGTHYTRSIGYNSSEGVRDTTFIDSVVVTAAMPTITEVTGTVSNGSTLTIAGSGFGAKAQAAPLMWDVTAQQYANGTNLNTYSGAEDGTALTSSSSRGFAIHDQGDATLRYSTSRTQRNANVLAHYAVYDEASAYVKLSMGVSCPYSSNADESLYPSVAQKKFYLSYWRKTSIPYGSTGGGDGSTKLLRIASSATGVGGGADVVTNDAYGTNDVAAWVGIGTETSWVRWEFYVDLNKHWFDVYKNGHYHQGQSDEENIEIRPSVDWRYNTPASGFEFDDATLPSNEAIVPMLFGYDDGHTVSQGQDIDMGEIYYDSTMARVEISTSATWNDSPASTMYREVQGRLTSWSPTEIQFVLNQGSFEYSSTAYVYVIDTDGKVNASGYPIEFGEAPAPDSFTIAVTENPAAAFTYSVVPVRQESGQPCSLIITVASGYVGDNLSVDTSCSIQPTGSDTIIWPHLTGDKSVTINGHEWPTYTRDTIIPNGHATVEVSPGDLSPVDSATACTTSVTTIDEGWRVDSIVHYSGGVRTSAVVYPASRITYLITGNTVDSIFTSEIPATPTISGAASYSIYQLVPERYYSGIGQGLIHYESVVDSDATLQNEVTRVDTTVGSYLHYENTLNQCAIVTDRCQFLEGATATTVMFKLRIPDKTQNMAIFEKGTVGSAFSAYFSTGVIKVVFSAYGSNYCDIPTTGINVGVWTWVTITYDGTQATNATRCKAYINGIQQELTFYGTIPAAITASAEPLWVGALHWISSFAYVGDMWHFAVYDRALTRYSINEVINADGYIVATDPKYFAFGNSITYGVGATEYDSCFVGRLQLYFDDTIYNQGYSGHEMADFPDKTYTTFLNLMDTTYCLYGYNDMRHRGAAAIGLSTFEGGIVSNLLRTSTISSQRVESNSAMIKKSDGVQSIETYAGYSILRSNTDGDSVSFKIGGSTIYVICTKNATGYFGSWKVCVDGDSVTTYDCGPVQATGYGKTTSPGYFRLSGLDDILHTITLKATSPGTDDWVFFEYAVGLGAQVPNLPYTVVGGCLRMTSAGYALGSPTWSNGSDSAVVKYNSIIDTAVNRLLTDGLNLSYANVTNYTPETDVSVDNIHPSNAGHRKIYEILANFIAEQIPFDTIVSGSGTIQVSPAPIDGAVPYGTVVHVTAVPAVGYVFSNWTGGFLSGNPDSVTVVQATMIGAVFAATPLIDSIRPNPQWRSDSASIYGVRFLSSGVLRNITTVPSEDVIQKDWSPTKIDYYIPPTWPRGWNRLVVTNSDSLRDTLSQYIAIIRKAN